MPRGRGYGGSCAGCAPVEIVAPDRMGRQPRRPLVTAVIGSTGDDALSGGAGIVFMRGGAGNDTYPVSNSADVVSEIVGQGTADISGGTSDQGLEVCRVVHFRR